MTLPFGFCLEQSSVVTWSADGFTCECSASHTFRPNEDGTYSPVERGDEDFWYDDPRLRQQVYRFQPPASAPEEPQS